LWWLLWGNAVDIAWVEVNNVIKCPPRPRTDVTQRIIQSKKSVMELLRNLEPKNSSLAADGWRSYISRL
jgi:hypothetical protein